MLVELMYQLMPPLKPSHQHADLVIAKKNVIMGQRTYIKQLASVATLIVQVCILNLIREGGACICLTYIFLFSNVGCEICRTIINLLQLCRCHQQHC
jgi:E3 ubiquitin-protein ligase TRIP12